MAVTMQIKDFWGHNTGLANHYQSFRDKNVWKNIVPPSLRSLKMEAAGKNW
jgi:hypothetical protein